MPVNRAERRQRERGPKKGIAYQVTKPGVKRVWRLESFTKPNTHSKKRKARRKNRG